MNDISPILLESVQGYFDMWFYADKEVKEIYKKVRNGTATFKEMKRFSERAGAILVESLKATFSADKLPDGKLYQNIAEKVIIPMLEDNHTLITEVCGYVADDLNKAARIGTKAVTAAFNADKAETVAQIAANCGEVVPGNKAAQLVENATMSMVDDFIQANLEFQKKLGLVPQIQRIYHKGKKHCEFCASLQYTGEYKGPGMPAEIFLRHRDCRCTLIYKPQKGPYQDPWSKAEEDDYQKLVADQRKYLTELDKMSPGERRLERNARARAQRRSQYSPSEWADRKAQQRIIAENRAAGKEYRAITQEKILKEKSLQEKTQKEKLAIINQVAKKGKPLKITEIAASTVTEKIKLGIYSTKLSDQNYNKHIEGHRDYDRYAEARKVKGKTPPSILTITKEKAQQIIDKKSGTGIIKTRRDGTPMDQEMISCDEIIGKYYSHGEWHDTSKAIIHHGRKGSHIVPHRGSNYD